MFVVTRCAALFSDVCLADAGTSLVAFLEPLLLFVVSMDFLQRFFFFSMGSFFLGTS